MHKLIYSNDWVGLFSLIKCIFVIWAPDISTELREGHNICEEVGNQRRCRTEKIAKEAW